MTHQICKTPCFTDCTYTTHYTILYGHIWQHLWLNYTEMASFRRNRKVQRPLVAHVEAILVRAHRRWRGKSSSPFQVFLSSLSRFVAESVAPNNPDITALIKSDYLRLNAAERKSYCREDAPPLEIQTYLLCLWTLLSTQRFKILYQKWQIGFFKVH